MFLYELAIALDRRSPELVDAASELGLGDVSPATDLDAQQVALLRSRFQPGAAPPLAPLGTPAPPPPSPPAPPPGPGAPATWGPPTGGAEALTGPRFAYPAGPTAGGQDEVPPPPPPHWGPPPGAPPGAGAAPAPTVRGMGRTQMIVIGAVAVLVLGLFGFMVVNTGPDKEREQSIRESSLDLGDDGAAQTGSSTTTQAAPEVTAPGAKDASDVVDLAAFCSGGAGVTTFEWRLWAAYQDKDLGDLAQLVQQRRGAWRSDLAVLASGAAPIYEDDIALYREGYEAFFDSVSRSSSFNEAVAGVDGLAFTKAANAGNEFLTQVRFLCK